MAALQQTAQTLSQRLDTAQAGLASTQSDTKALQDGLTATQGDVTKLRDGLTATQSDVSKVKDNLSAVQGDVTKAKDSAAAAVADLAKTKADLTATSNAWGDLKNSFLLTRDDVAKLKTDLTAARQDIAKLTTPDLAELRQGFGILALNLYYVASEVNDLTAYRTAAARVGDVVLASGDSALSDTWKKLDAAFNKAVATAANTPERDAANREWSAAETAFLLRLLQMIMG